MKRSLKKVRETSSTDDWFVHYNRAIELYMEGKSKCLPQVVYPKGTVEVCREDDAVLMSFPDDMLVFQHGDESVETFGRDGEELFLALPSKRK